MKTIIQILSVCLFFLIASNANAQTDEVADQAKALFGIKNLRARATELRKAGLVVKTDTNKAGKTTYSIV
jgi:hypothetical protein